MAARTMTNRKLSKGEVERLHFDALQEKVSELAGTVRAGAPPEPDIVVVTVAGTIGVELTSIQTPRREQESLRDRAVEIGQREYERRGHPPALVSNFWGDSPLRSQVRTNDLGMQLVALIEQHRPKTEVATVELDWEELNPVGLSGMLHHVRIARLKNLTQTHWTSPDAGYVGPEIEIVRRLLDEKESKLAGYRRGCREVWLLMVTEGVSISRTLDVEKLLAHRRVAIDRGSQQTDWGCQASLDGAWPPVARSF